MKRLQKELANYWKNNFIIRNAIKDIVKKQLERNESQIEDKQIIFDLLTARINNYIPDDDHFSLYQYEYDNYEIYSGVIPPATVAERDKQLEIEEGFDEIVLSIANETYRLRKNALGHLDFYRQFALKYSEKIFDKNLYMVFMDCIKMFMIKRRIR